MGQFCRRCNPKQRGPYPNIRANEHKWRPIGSNENMPWVVVTIPQEGYYIDCRNPCLCAFMYSASVLITPDAIMEPPFFLLAALQNFSLCCCFQHIYNFYLIDTVILTYYIPCVP